MDADPSPPLVLIEWLDSGQPVPGWQWLEAIEPRRPHLCVSVGFLMQDDASAKVLAPNLGASNGSGEWDQASGVITIPASAPCQISTKRLNQGVVCWTGCPSGRQLGIRGRLQARRRQGSGQSAGLPTRQSPAQTH
jgi:hypothetical protein